MEGNLTREEAELLDIDERIQVYCLPGRQCRRTVALKNHLERH